LTGARRFDSRAEGRPNEEAARGSIDWLIAEFDGELLHLLPSDPEI